MSENIDSVTIKSPLATNTTNNAPLEAAVTIVNKENVTTWTAN